MTPRAIATAALLLGALGSLALLGPVSAAGAAAAAAAAIGGRLPGAALLGPAAFAGLLAAAAWGGDRAEVLGVVLAALAAHRLGARPLLADRVPVLLATLCSLVAVSVRDDAGVVAPAVLAAATLPVAMSVGRLRWAGAAGLSAVGGGLALGLWLLAPRLVVHPDDDRTGFAEHVELGTMDRLLDDRTVVFRARVMPDAPAPTVWRGRALDTFDGRAWTVAEARTAVDVTGPRLLPPDAFVVEIEPVAPAEVLFTTGQVVDVRTDGPPLFTDGRGGFRAQGVRRWRLVSLPPLGVGARVAWDDTPGDLGAATALPGGLDARIRPLAHRLAGEGSDAERVARLADALRAGWSYTRTPRDRGDPAPLATFLFETRSGHCEYFAAALAVLARAEGIPSRVVNGYAGGELGPDGWTTVRASDAHAWVEVFVEGAWRAVDATPDGSATVAAPAAPPAPFLRWDLAPRWAERARTYDRDVQVRAVLAAARALQRGAGGVPWCGLSALAALGAGAVALAAWVGRRAVPRVLDPAPPRPHPVAAVHARARRELWRRGVRPPPALPPVEAARWARAASPGDDTDALLELAWLLYEARLGTEPAGARARARELLRRVRAGR